MKSKARGNQNGRIAFCVFTVILPFLNYEED